MKKYTLILPILLIPFLLLAQQTRWIELTSSSADALSAIQIDIRDTIEAINSPKGYGKQLEFKGNDKKSLLYIEREHNTVWYRFDIPNDGELLFELTPYSIDDDYDFMLFKYTNGVNFFSEIIEKTNQPLRTNISRNNKEIESKTGLKSAAEANTVHSGPGLDYSNSLEVKKGETYYLLVDNVYKNGKGHRLTFEMIVLKPLIEEKPITSTEEVGDVMILNEVIELVDAPSFEEAKEAEEDRFLIYDLEGVVIDDDTEQPLQADITLIDVTTGEVIAKTQSDSLTGEYKVTIKEDAEELHKKRYNLEITKDDYFFESMDIKPYDLPDLSEMKTRKRIPKIKKGKVYRITNINFYGDSPKPLPTSLPVFQSLLRLMEKNPTLRISVEGHTNGCHQSWAYSKKLSTARAETVRNYLIENGIDGSRLKSKGFSCDKMLYPNPMSARQQMLNRRVEIRIL